MDVIMTECMTWHDNDSAITMHWKTIVYAILQYFTEEITNTPKKAKHRNSFIIRGKHSQKPEL